MIFFKSLLLSLIFISAGNASVPVELVLDKSILHNESLELVVKEGTDRFSNALGILKVRRT